MKIKSVLVVRTAVMAGGFINHNQTMRTKTGVKTGGFQNHNQTPLK